MRLHALSAGAAQGVVSALQAQFGVEAGVELRATFGAVGAMNEKLQAGELCDVIILTAAIIDDLQRAGQVIADTAAPLGRVRTGIAVRSGEPLPPIGDTDALRRSLLASSAIYIPDPQRAT